MVVRDSDVLEAIRLLKLWKVRRTLRIKQFVFELLVIDLLEGKKAKSLEDQLKHVWTKIKDSADPINVKDPANPSGNDLTQVIKDMWPQLQAAASSTLQTIETLGWGSVFGTVSESSAATIVEKAQRAAASVSNPTRPWCDEA